jgi:hypothetical protein
LPYIISIRENLFKLLKICIQAIGNGVKLIAVTAICRQTEVNSSKVSEKTRRFAKRNGYSEQQL